MSRVCGLVLIWLAAWQLSLGLWPAAVVEAPIGLYLMLRGGGACPKCNFQIAGVWN